MKTCGIFAVSLFGALVAAAPVNKRDVVWVTETAVNIVTVPVTRTVWVDAEEATSVPVVQNNAVRPTRTRHTISTASSAAVSSTTVSVAPVASSSAYVAPAPSTTSVYVAPTTSSTSVYVAPTTSSTSVYVAPTTTSVYVAPTTTSVYVAPTTSSTSAYVAPTISSTSVYVAPTTTQAPTSVYVAPSTTSSAAAATSTSPSSSSGGLAGSGVSYTGDLTWYQTGSGACGWVNTASEAIVAISQKIFDDPAYYQVNPNNNPLCGRYVSITGANGSKYQAKVVDRCTGCAAADLDLSEDFFNTVTNNGDGRVSGMTWSWV